jgi:hypothetical protein
MLTASTPTANLPRIMRVITAVTPLALALTASALGVAPAPRVALQRSESSRPHCSPTPPTIVSHRPHGKEARQLWAADMEEGTLADWEVPGHANAGGGEFDSGSGDAFASRTRSHSGRWGARLGLRTRRGGTRLFRWLELRAHRDVVVSVWLEIPRRYRLTADPATGRFWNVFQFKSRTASGANDPLWFLNLATPRNRRPRLQLVWWPRTLEGPRPAERGFQRFAQNVATVPIGRWFRITARLRQSSGFDGVLCVWQGRRLLFDRHGVRTSYRNCSYNAWCADDEWSVNHYSDGLVPAPSAIYLDDARIAAR